MHLYLHIPFCHRICPYCAFHKHTLMGYQVDDFCEALAAEIAWVGAFYGVAGRLQGLRSIHLGGGTPSLLKSGQLARLFEALAKICELGALEEIALEANPSTFDLSKARAWSELGVSRVSLGVQSFQPQFLQLLGRDHHPEQAVEAALWVKEAGITQLNLDLMFSLPGQDEKTWSADLQQALALQPEHISAYNLTWEEDTEFLRRLQRGEFQQSALRDAACFELSQTMLSEAGFEHYEVSNFAQQGMRSVHNAGYWSGRDYLGLGPGAVSTWAGKRWKNLPDTKGWQQSWLAGRPAPRVEEENLSFESLRVERIALGLRTIEGIEHELLREEAQAGLMMMEEAGLLRVDEFRVKLTKEGFGLADEVALQLI